MSENPHAFPLPFDSGASGMTLRDWFAGQVAPAIVAAMANGDYKLDKDMTPAARMALDAYHAADAMLAERAKVQP